MISDVLALAGLAAAAVLGWRWRATLGRLPGDRDDLHDLKAARRERRALARVCKK